MITARRTTCAERGVALAAPLESSVPDRNSPTMRGTTLAALLLAVAAHAAAQAPPTASPPPPAAPGAAEMPAPPPTLVWLVVDDGSRRTIASAAQVAALTAMTERAAARGIELEFPTLDGNDLARIDSDTLWSGDPRRAYVAAQRYRTPTVLVARLSRLGAGWVGRMTLVDAFGSESYESRDSDSSTVLAAATDGLADRLEKRRVLGASERVVAEHRLWIAGVDSPADYGRALKYLESLPVVEAVAPEGAEGDRLLVRATLTVRLERFAQMLALGSTMRLDGDVPAPGGQAVLRLAR